MLSFLTILVGIYNMQVCVTILAVLVLLICLIAYLGFPRILGAVVAVTVVAAVAASSVSKSVVGGGIDEDVRFKLHK